MKLDKRTALWALVSSAVVGGTFAGVAIVLMSQPGTVPAPRIVARSGNPSLQPSNAATPSSAESGLSASPSRNGASQPKTTSRSSTTSAPPAPSPVPSSPPAPSPVPTFLHSAASALLTESDMLDGWGQQSVSSNFGFWCGKSSAPTGTSNTGYRTFAGPASQKLVHRVGAYDSNGAAIAEYDRLYNSRAQVTATTCTWNVGDSRYTAGHPQACPFGEHCFYVLAAHDSPSMHEDAITFIVQLANAVYSLEHSTPRGERVDSTSRYYAGRAETRVRQSLS